MIAVPDPIPLEPPPGRLGALEDVVEDVGMAAFWLTVLSTDLAGPAASAPGWLGADAATAAAEVGAVADIARQCSVAVGAAAHRLRLHHDLLREVRQRVQALQEEQREESAVMWRALSRIEDPQLAAMIDAPERVAAIEEFRVGEASRLRRHAALLEEAADDAAATAGVLAESSAVVGGRGTRGDGARVLAHLAVELPGWGERELKARAVDLAVDFRSHLAPDDRDELARRALALAGSPVFAAALLAELGRDGVLETLVLLGDGVLGPESSLALLTAKAFGAARAGDGPADPVRQVLDSNYVDADAAPWHDPDLVMFGMAAVLSASSTLRSGGLGRTTVLGWAQQMLGREHAMADVPRELRRQPTTGTPVDPLTAVLDHLAATDEPSLAAAVLADQVAWPLLLARSWDDGGAALADVVELAGADPGRDGQMATRLGLEALGAGLADNGDPANWHVDRVTASAVSPALASAVAQHVTVAPSVLGLGVDGELRGRATDIMRGLGYLTIDAAAARTVGAALYDWARAQPLTAELIGGPIPPPAVVVPSVFLAVRQYGQRLDHALHGFEEQEHASWRKTLWDGTVGVLTFIPKRGLPGFGVVVGLAEEFLQTTLGFDGTWDNGRDDGLHFDGEDAAGAVLALTPEGLAAVDVLAGQARVVFEQSAEALGAPLPPTSPDYTFVTSVMRLSQGTSPDAPVVVER